MRVYIAGGMRGYKDFNFPAFDAAAAKLRSQGYEVRSPAEKDREVGFDPTRNSLAGFDLEAAFRWDIESVLWADALVVLPGWQTSIGANLEVNVARAIGTPVFPLGVKPKAKEHAGRR